VLGTQALPDPPGGMALIETGTQSCRLAHARARQESDPSCDDTALHIGMHCPAAGSAIRIHRDTRHGDPFRAALSHPDAAEDDFIGLAARCDPPAQVVPVHFPWPEGAEDLTVLDTEQTYAAVRELGSDAHLERVTTVSTTSAFQHAVQHSGLTSVALASVYHPSATDHFIDRLAEVGATTISRVDADASSDRELATWSSDQIASLVRACVHDDAQAVVLPETALHTATIADLLDQAAGRPVLTATQVTIWAAYRALAQHPRTTNAGILFVGAKSARLDGANQG
jgi:hypothetical protein